MLGEQGLNNNLLFAGGDKKLLILFGYLSEFDSTSTIDKLWFTNNCVIQSHASCLLN